MRVVYLGTDAMLPCLEYLLDEHEVMALYTCGGEEDYFRSVQITSMAREAGIPCRTEPIGEAAERELIRAGCELFISADYGLKIPVLDEEEGFFGINIHTSLLPEGRSYCPVECALERGEKETGVTIHKLADRFDRGDIISQKKCRVHPEDDSIDLYLKLAYMARQMLKDVMENFSEKWRLAVPQQADGSFWRLEHFRDARLNHDMSVEEANRIYRIYNRMTRIRVEGKVFYIAAFESGRAVIDDDIISLGGQMLYRLRDGHLRLVLEEARNPEAVWECDRYPFRF